MVKKLFLVYLLLFAKISVAQHGEPTSFVPPVEGQLLLSGTFGELRSGHFHTGIDIKTDGVVGKPVFAIDDGYISRICVSPTGFGKAIYISHDNGLTSVYAHLLSFKSDVADYVRNIQLEKESFAIDVQVNKGVLMVKKGEQIALSGNSGGSAGPHLHFEIRETKTANPIDPVSFDFLNIIDNISPIIHRICFFPLDSASFINGRNNPVERKVVSDNDKFVLYNPKPLLIKGDVYFGISTIDKMDNSYNKNGIHSIRCYVDSSLFYEFVADTTSFSQAHCVNAIIDYPKYVNDEERFYKSYKEPNCSSMMLKYVDNDGILKLEDDSIHTVTCLIADVNDNVSTLKFDVRRDTACYEHVSLNKSHYLKYNRSYNLQLGDAKIFIGENALFDDVAVDLTIDTVPCENLLVPQYHIGDNTVATNERISISLKIPENIAHDARNKLYVVSKSNDEWNYVNGKNKDGYITVRVRNFGSFSMMMDTVPPEISSEYLLDDAVTDVSKRKRVRVTIKDDQTGISSYYPTLNGKWIIMDYDAKNDVLIYEFDDFLQEGINELKIVVKDMVGNTSEYIRQIKY